MLHILFLIFSKINTIVCIANNYSVVGVEYFQPLQDFQPAQNIQPLKPLRSKGSMGSMSSKG
jgi:hypothetical protein